MKKVLLVFVICLVSCANPLYTQDAAIYNRVLEYNGATVEDYWALRTDEYSYIVLSHGNVKTRETFKKAIIDRIKDYDFLIGDGKLLQVRIVAIIVSRSGDRTCSGLYASEKGIVYLKLEDESDTPETDMEHVFCHEQGHAFWRTLSDDQRKEWYLLYQERLDEIGLEEPLGWKYKDSTREMIQPFPSRYCLHSCSEYFAECFMFYSVDVARLNLDNFEEKKLLRKHIEEVRKRHGEARISKEYY